MARTRAEAAREKLIHAIVFFANNTNHCHKLKLFKLLHALDFDVYRETGKSVTGLGYFAWPNGPVPNELFEELNHPKPDMKAAIAITTTSAADLDLPGGRMDFKPRIKFSEAVFTQRELDHLTRLAEIFGDATAGQMTAVSHAPGQPWQRVYEVEGKKQQPIPYRMALETKSKARVISQEQAELIEEEEREGASLFE